MAVPLVDLPPQARGIEEWTVKVLPAAVRGDSL